MAACPISFLPHGGANVFHAVLIHGKAMHIAGAAAERIRSRLPDWYLRDFAVGRSFVTMPPVIHQRAVGPF